MKIKNWVLAMRPKTLTAAFIPVISATALVHFESGDFNWSLSIFALMGALFIQIATNFFNDAIDFKKGADTKSRIGPKRFTHSGSFSYKSMMRAGVFCCILATICGLPLVIHGGWPLVAIGVLSVMMAYSYTGGPFPLAYLGLGDLFVILFFGLIAVGGVYYLQTESYSLSALILGLQIGFLSTVLIVINNFRDVEQDKGVNKKTLAVRFGYTFTRVEVLCLYGLTLILSYYWFIQGSTLAFILSLLPAPWMLLLVIKIFKENPSPKFNQFLTSSAKIQLIFTLLLSVGLFVS